MKKNKCFCIEIGGILLALIFFGTWSNIKIKDFNSLDYQEVVEEFSVDEYVVEINDDKTAKQEAEKLWVKEYGKDVIKLKPYKVSYDKERKVWLIEGSIPNDKLGGVPNALIESSGKVLAIWHTK